MRWILRQPAMPGQCPLTRFVTRQEDAPHSLRKGEGMAHPNADLLNKGYDAFDKGDMDTIRGLFADDIVFHVPGNSQVSGEYRGTDGVFGFFGKLVELSGGTFKIT